MFGKFIFSSNCRVEFCLCFGEGTANGMIASSCLAVVHVRRCHTIWNYTAIVGAPCRLLFDRCRHALHCLWVTKIYQFFTLTSIVTQDNKISQLFKPNWKFGILKIFECWFCMFMLVMFGTFWPPQIGWFNFRFKYIFNTILHFFIVRGGTLSYKCQQWKNAKIDPPYLKDHKLRLKTCE